MPSLQFDNQGAGSAGDVHSTQQGGTKLQADMGSAQQWRRRRRRRRGREREHTAADSQCRLPRFLLATDV